MSDGCRFAAVEQHDRRNERNRSKRRVHQQQQRKQYEKHNCHGGRTRKLKAAVTAHARKGAHYTED